MLLMFKHIKEHPSCSRLCIKKPLPSFCALGSQRLRQVPGARRWLITLAESTSGSYYDLLGISTDASVDEIKMSYRKKARQLHPDVNKSQDAEEEFMEMKRAYDTLSRPGPRLDYDSKLGLASARAKDPRFARFERWRSEVIPLLRVYLDEWTQEVDQVIQQWVDDMAGMERELQMTMDQSTRAAASLEEDMQKLDSSSGSSRLEAGPQLVVNQLLKGCEEGLERVNHLHEIVDSLRYEAGNGEARIKRIFDKRGEQVETLFPAYPDIVWIDVWEDVSGSWMARMLARLDVWTSRCDALQSRAEEQHQRWRGLQRRAKGLASKFPTR